MPDVAGRWLRLLLCTLGGIFWREISYLGVAGLDTPIWDVLARQGEQERVLTRVTMRPRSPAFQIRQVVPAGLLWVSFAAGLVGHGFLHWNFYIYVVIMYINILYPFLCIRGGGNGWMAMDAFRCRSYFGSISVILS